MARDTSDKSDYVLVYDGEGGVRMAPAGARIDLPPERHISLPGEPERHPTFETVSVPRRPAYVLPLVGAACLGLVGLALGFAARPQLAAHAAASPATVPTKAQAGDAQMKVMVLAPPPPAPAVATGRLDVLPADRRQRAVPAVPIPAPPPSRAVTADCGRAPSPAAAMVCADPDLARADRRMARAFRAAARSGAPLDQLRAEQDDWLEIREDAAQRSTRAVAQVYDQRIAELEDMAAAAEPR